MKESIARCIDYTLLRADATKAEIEKLCEEAIEYGFKSVCVNPFWVKVANDIVSKSAVNVCTVIGFPLGATTTDVKKYEALEALANGASELDVVMNVGAFKANDDDTVLKDIEAIVNVASEKDALVKVIIETALLTEEEKVRACQLAVKAGADYVKTSTGFSSGGATVRDVQLMRSVVGKNVGVKASGGIKTYEDARAMIEAGATRIGASAGVAIVRGER